MQNGIFIRVFIASPGDVQNERDAACQVVHQWNAVHSLKKSILIEPVRVETHSHAVQGGHPQDLINGQLLDRCDLLVAILWSRLGTPTNTDPSGTVQEIREFAAKKGAERVLLFFCDRDFSSNADLDQVQAVRDFKNSVKQECLYIPYTAVNDFAEQFRHQLDMALNRLIKDDDFEMMTNEREGKRLVTFEPEANTLLSLASIGDQSRIILTRLLSGHELSAGGVLLNKRGNERSESEWESGLDQLEQIYYAADMGHEGEVFRLTKAGYEAADNLWHVLLLRRIESLQADEYEYVELAMIAKEDCFGLKLSHQTCREKVAALTKVEQLEVVNSDSGITAARLNDLSRKTICEHDGLEFREPEGEEDTQ